MRDLRGIIPERIVRGALLRPDGVAVGLVGGGAPPWDLLALADKGRAAEAYHRLLLALDGPLDVYCFDQPPSIGAEIDTLLQRQARAEQPLLADARGELADYLAGLAQSGAARSTQVIWAVSSGERQQLPPLLQSLRRGEHHMRQPGQAALADALDRARLLADALAALGASPAPRLLEAEEIARLLYLRSDPIRAWRAPLHGPLLERVRRLVTSH